MKKQLYTDEQLLQILRNLAAKLGQSPTQRELKARRDLPDPTTYHRRFETWNAALKTAGLKTRYITYTDEQLLQILRNLAAKLGQSPTHHELLAHHTIYGACINRFGTISSALETAGLKSRRRLPHSTYTDEQLLQILRDLAVELDQSPTIRVLNNRRNLPSSGTYIRHFETWNTALKAAGLETRHRRPRRPVYTNKQLLQTLRDLATNLERSPTYLDLWKCQDVPARATYLQRFGTWNAALEAAGLETNRQTYTDKQLLKNLRDLATELKRSPTSRDLDNRCDLASYTTYTNRFGTWNAALEAAGLETLISSNFTSSAEAPPVLVFGNTRRQNTNP